MATPWIAGSDDPASLPGSFLTMIEQVTHRMMGDRQFGDERSASGYLGTSTASVSVARGDDATGRVVRRLGPGGGS